MFNVRIDLATPLFDGDEDISYSFECEDKKDLHKVERSLLQGLHQLMELTKNEIETGQKAFDAGGDPQLVTFEVNITKNGADFSGYKFRWPNQEVEARAFLVGMIDGLMKGVGKDKGRVTKKKVRG